jgi:hypothetical protein
MRSLPTNRPVLQNSLTKMTTKGQRKARDRRRQKRKTKIDSAKMLGDLCRVNWGAGTGRGAEQKGVQ